MGLYHGEVTGRYDRDFVLSPEPLRNYIYDINMARYGDPLGPTYDYLKADGKSDAQIIESSSRSNPDVNKLLSGFEEWLRGQVK